MLIWLLKMKLNFNGNTPPILGMIWWKNSTIYHLYHWY